MQASRQIDDEQAKVVALAAMAENFGKEFSAPLLNLWLDLLAPYPAAQVQAAVKEVLEQYEFKTIPAFAVVKRCLDDLSGISGKALDLQAAAEWGVLLEAIPHIGRNRMPDLHPTTAHVVHIMGGWVAVCSWESGSLDFKRRDFIAHWKDAHGRVESMRLGAESVCAALAAGQSKSRGPLHVSSGFVAAISGVNHF